MAFIFVFMLAFASMALSFYVSNPKISKSSRSASSRDKSDLKECVISPDDINSLFETKFSYDTCADNEDEYDETDNWTESMREYVENSDLPSNTSPETSDVGQSLSTFDSGYQFDNLQSIGYGDFSGEINGVN